MNFFQEIELSNAQADAIARGLYAIAKSDGVHEQEEQLIAAFWAESGGTEEGLAGLAARDGITTEELAQALPGSEERKVFLKSAMLMMLADGQVSEKERALFASYVSGLQMTEQLPGIEVQVKEFLLNQLSHIQNVDAVAEVAKKLAI